MVFTNHLSLHKPFYTLPCWVPCLPVTGVGSTTLNKGSTTRSPQQSFWLPPWSLSSQTISRPSPTEDQSSDANLISQSQICCVHFYFDHLWSPLDYQETDKPISEECFFLVLKPHWSFWSPKIAVFHTSYFCTYESRDKKTLGASSICTMHSIDILWCTCSQVPKS